MQKAKSVIFFLFLAIGLVFVFLLNTKIVFGGEDCFIQLEIQEKKTAGGTIVFSLLKVENVYGQYDSFVRPYLKGTSPDYILRTYDKDNKILNEYSLLSARFIFWDGEDENGNPTGGVKEINEGIITAVIPYDTNIAKIAIDSKGEETDLGVKTTDLKCERTCKIENERGDYTRGERCCLDFTPAIQRDGSFVCVKCGDGVCSGYEDQHSCYKDCGPKPSPTLEQPKPPKQTFIEKFGIFIDPKDGARNILIAFFFILILVIISWSLIAAIRSRRGFRRLGRIYFF